MKKHILVIAGVVILSACSTQKRLDGSTYEPNFTTKPTFCYQLPPADQKPNVNCIGSSGSK